MGFNNVVKLIGDKLLWIATPQKKSKQVIDINQNIVRQICLQAGLVDFKICSIDEEWSGLLFKKRNK